MRKLRIGILTDSLDISNWLYSALEKVVNCGYADICLLVLNKDIKKSVKLNKFNNLFYKVFKIVDEKLFNEKPNAFKKRSIKSISGQINVLEVYPQKKKYSDYFPADDIKKIKSYNLDILIRNGFRILKGDILSIPKCGIWSYHHGDNKINRGGPPGFWEVYYKESSTGCILQIINNQLDNGLVIDKLFSKTDFLSPNRNKNSLYWSSASLLVRQIKNLYNYGSEKYLTEINNKVNKLNIYYRDLFRAPGNISMAIIFIKYFGRLLKHFYFRLFYKEQWNIMFTPNNGNLNLEIRKFKKLIPPKDKFWADPFVLTVGEINYVFIEEYIYKKKKGHISLLEINNKGELISQREIISEKYHLSYPFVFEYENKYYLIPESKEAKKVLLYECVQFPYKWKYKETLINDIWAVDSTLLYHNGKWWLFTNVINFIGASSFNELHIFYSDSPVGSQWIPHKLNPVISDNKLSRPAGNIFSKEGKLIRPSQINTKRYGYGISLNEIIRLSEEFYEEIQRDVILPEWDKSVKGCHTFSCNQNIILIDSVKLIRKF